MRYYNNILETIGNTPLVKVNKVLPNPDWKIFAKLEFFNPGGSIKDRMATYMLEVAEKRGDVTPKTVVVENSSGNTGAALSMIAAARGMEGKITCSEKTSQEKVDRMQALGTNVTVCPAGVPHDDPQSYYSTAARIAKETDNSYYPDQYNNKDNAEAHYHTTGPEIWEQSEGEIDVFVSSMGTGGTISGVGRFLKEKNPDVKIIGVDPEGSTYYHYFKTGDLCPVPNPSKIEGMGDEIIVGAIDFSVIDDMVQVTDQEGFTTARRLVRQEGILCGGSCGAAMAGALKVAPQYEGKNIVVMFPDSANIYLSKFLNDDWMRENGFKVES